MKVMGRISCGFLAALALLVASTTARANINMELRPSFQIATVGQTVDLGLYLVSDTAAPQFTNLVYTMFSWDTVRLQLTGTSQTGASPLVATSTFPLADPWGNINNASPPTTGTGFHQVTAGLGQPPPNIPATSGGTLITTFKFTALALGLTTVSIIPDAGIGGHTQVFGADVPNSDVTGTIGSADILIVPEPAGFALLLMGVVMTQVRRARR